MKLSYVILMAAFLVAPSLSSAEELWLGGRSYHFKRTGSGCTNESHHLYAYRKGDYHIGTYVNSQCNRSYLVGRSYDWKYGFGLDISAVTGYPESMHIVGNFIFIPQLTYLAFYKRVGVRLIYVPFTLVGAGLAVRL